MHHTLDVQHPNPHPGEHAEEGQAGCTAWGGPEEGQVRCTGQGQVGCTGWVGPEEARGGQTFLVLLHYIYVGTQVSTGHLY